MLKNQIRNENENQYFQLNENEQQYIKICGMPLKLYLGKMYSIKLLNACIKKRKKVSNWWYQLPPWETREIKANETQSSQKKGNPDENEINETENKRKN